MAFAIASPSVAYASTWYGSHITLPRGGGWWRTVSRKATSNTTGIKASDNVYQVIGVIKNSGGKIIGGKNNYVTFGKSNHKAKYLKTYAKGSKVHAGFRANAYNPYTTTAYLEWRP